MPNTLSTIISNLQSQLSNKITTDSNASLSSLSVNTITIPSGGVINYDDNETGNLRNFPLRVGTKNSEGTYVRYYPFRIIPTTSTSTYGFGFAIETGGTVAIAGGEAMSTIASNETPNGETEAAWVVSDGNVRIVANCQTYANRKEVWIDTAGALRPNADNTQTCGASAKRWKQLWAGTGTVQTSDERKKDDIGEIPDEVLDAWGEVEFVRFKYKDAKQEKGEKARWHVGVIAQRIDRIFKAHGLDAFEYGLLCYDAWKGGDITKGEPEADGDLWSIRYDEALAMECAYQRRELRRMKEKLG